MLGAKVETSVTWTSFTMARVKGLASHDRLKGEPPGKRRLECLRGRSLQDRLLLLENADQFIGCGAHKRNGLQFTYFLQ